MDDDDEWLPEKIETQIIAAQESQSKAVCCNAFRKINGQLQKDLYSNFTEKIINFENLIYSNYIICSSAMCHRSLLNIVIGFPIDKKLKALEDSVLWLRIATQTNFSFVNTPLLIYDDNPSQSIRSKSESVFDQRKKIFENLMLWAFENKQNVNNKYLDTFKLEYLNAKKKSSGLFAPWNFDAYKKDVSD